MPFTWIVPFTQTSSNHVLLDNLKLLHTSLNGLRDNIANRSSPTRMNRSNDSCFMVNEQHWNTISRPNNQRKLRLVRHQSIPVTLNHRSSLDRTVKNNNPGAVHLLQDHNEGKRRRSGCHCPQLNRRLQSRRHVTCTKEMAEGNHVTCQSAIRQHSVHGHDLSELPFTDS